MTVVSPAAAEAMGRTEVAKPSTPIPAHPIVAYVHDARRGEVTIVSGTVERTFRDPALAKRLVSAARSHGVK